MDNNKCSENSTEKMDEQTVHNGTNNHKCGANTSTKHNDTVSVTEYVKRNINGSWEDISVNAKVISKIRLETLYANARFMLKIKQLYWDFTEAERIAIFKTVAQHYSYRRDALVDRLINQGKKKKDK